jgi:hypothetical protein
VHRTQVGIVALLLRHPVLSGLLLGATRVCCFRIYQTGNYVTYSKVIVLVVRQREWGNGRDLFQTVTFLHHRPLKISGAS